VLIAVTFASAMTALEGSVMRPVREALVDCARRTLENETRNKNARARIQPIVSPQQHAEAVSVLSAL